ncbi:MAG TPA: hypothetical protein VEG38_02200 [Acidimicrobiia bacterium]|nr:hypothetical protein [Acidimicrobiia bacterium]
MAVQGEPQQGGGGLTFLDGELSEVSLDDAEASTFLALVGDLDAVTVSACPTCKSRILAAVALVDLLDAAPPHPRAPELVELADEAPTLHVYLVDEGSSCGHEAWLDPGYDEWTDAVEG